MTSKELEYRLMRFRGVEVQLYIVFIVWSVWTSTLQLFLF